MQTIADISSPTTLPRSSDDAQTLEATPASVRSGQIRQTPLVAARAPDHRSRIQVGRVEFGGPSFNLIAGPCAVEDAAQIDACAAAVAASGAALLRGGVFKPRTSPYSFRGLGREGLQLLARSARHHDLGFVTEVMQPQQVRHVELEATMLQVGARNMQNFALLEAVGRSSRPVLLERGIAATLDEFLHAAEYILESGNPNVILCERGIRSFDASTRFTLDLSAVVVLLERTHLPIIVDPSHAAGARRFVPALTRAARAVGAHGVIVEIHPDPENALSDGAQALTLERWAQLAAELTPA